MRKAVCLGIMLALTALGALAQEEQKSDPKTVKQNYKQAVEAMESVAKEKKALAEEQVKIQKELSDIQSGLVTTAGKIKQQERVLLDMESGLAKLSGQEKLIAADFRLRQRELSQLLQSMVKLSKVPPELVVAMPGDFSETMRTAKVLGLSSRALSQKADKVHVQLVKIHALQAKIRENSATIRDRKTSLEKDQLALKDKLSTRSELQKQLKTQQAGQEQQLARLSEESATLKDLLTQIEENREKDEADEADSPSITPKDKPKSPKPLTKRPKSGSTNFTAAKGKISLPAEGKIFSFYGDKTEDGAQSRGINIETRESAQVTALFGGEVVYTGPFRDYGNLVIVRHEGNYHTLLAGLKRITAETGQTVLEGEPIGEMGNKKRETTLYVEIRKDNRPIDPMPWLSSGDSASKQKIIR